MNEYTLRCWYDIFKNNNELVEIRILDPETKRSYSGYFTDIETILKEVKKYERSNLYFTLNVIDPACYSREQHDKISTRPKSTTSDNEIIARKWCLIDIDCEKPSDTNSTDEEKELAKEVVNNVYAFLRDEGFEKPVVCDSANGFHLLYKQAMLSNEKNTETMKNFLKVLDMYFSTDKVKIDCSTFNPSRICKLYGVYSRKGADTKERPQRESKILKVPSEVKVTPNEYFEKVASYLPQPEKRDMSNNYGASTFNLDEFIAKYNIRIRNVVEAKDFTKYVLEECPFNSSHRAPDSAIFKMRDGSFGFKCLHNSDSHYTFRDFRLFYDKDAYTKKDYREFQFKQKYYSPQPPVFEPIEESEEKGKKWLTSKDIKQKRESDIVAIPTGFNFLDKHIRGLILGEVTILSGLNGCVDCDTEFFDGVKWKRISDFEQGDKVLQYNADGTAEMVNPQRYIKVQCDTLHLMKTKYGLNQCISDEHNVVYQTSKGNIAKKTMSDLISQHNKSIHGFNGKFYTTFKYCGCGIDLSDEQIRIMCAVICDGSFCKGFSNKKIVRFNIKKRRKQDRLECLPEKANIPYRKEQYRPNDKDYITYIFESPRLEKEFGDYWYNCNEHQLKVIADEILHWDGYITKTRKSFSTTSKRNADFVQFVFSAIGIRATILIDDRVGNFHSNGKYQYKNICYEVHICCNNMVSFVNSKNKNSIIDYKTKDGYKYCFTVPSGMLVLRREGRINITGNSGKSSWLNSLMLNVMQRGFKVACFSGELTDFNVMKWLALSAAGKNYVSKVEGSEYAYEVFDGAYDKIADWLYDKFYLFNNNYGNKFEQILADLNEVIEKGVNLVVIDNLMALSIDNKSGDKNEKQKAFILDVVELAKKKNVHVIVVCHPRKESGTQTLLRKESIAGSSDLSNAVQNVAIVHRCGEDFSKRASEFFGKDKADKYMEYSNVVEWCKSRSYGVVDLLVGMYYEVETKRFKNYKSEHIIYGWQDNPVQQTMTAETSQIEPPKKEYPIVNPYEMESEDVMWGQGAVPF